MQSYLEDRVKIADLINGWMHRDLAQWDELRNLFHPGGTIEVTWFEGAFGDFVAGGGVQAHGRLGPQDQALDRYACGDLQRPQGDH